MPRPTVRDRRWSPTSPPPHIVQAVRAALNGGSVRGTNGDAPVVTIGTVSGPPTWLSDLVGTATVVAPSSESGSRALVAVADDVRRSDRSDGVRPAKPWIAEPAEQAYRSLVPGGLLVLRIRQGQVGTRGPKGKTVDSTVDELGVGLFQAGFVDTRFVTSPSGELTVLAHRGLGPPPTERAQVLSVILPAYNEKSTFATVMDALVAKTIPGVEIEIIVVESNSTDGTRDVAMTFADHPRVTVVLEARPQGKGHAVRTGLARARGDIVLIQDADLEYDLDDYERLLEPIRRFEASFVLGRRMNPTGSWGMRHFETQHLVSRAMNVGHIGFAALFNAVYRQHLKDPFTMYKVFRRDCLTGMLLECDRFDFDWELTAKLIRAGYHPVEIPVSYRSRSFSEGKKVRLFGDPWTWVVACARYRFAPIYEEFSATYDADELISSVNSHHEVVIGSKEGYVEPLEEPSAP
jgi:glycosyltransferase involved in cell wall biosynthesis